MVFFSSATVLCSRIDNSALRPASRVSCCGRDADVDTLVESANRACHSAIADSVLRRELDGIHDTRQVLTFRSLRTAHVLSMVRNAPSVHASTMPMCPLVCV